MNLQGSGKRLMASDYDDVAKELGIKDPKKLQAIVQVEARGRGFGSAGLIKCLYEPHIAYRLTSGKVRAALVKAGLAYAKWGAKPYSAGPKANHRKVLSAVEIAGPMAFQFASWGLPQMMGFNAKDLGYINARQMVIEMLSGEREQLRAMGLFLKWKGLIGKINAAGVTAASWSPIAHKYNGSGYRKNGYHIKLAAAYKRLMRGGNQTGGQAINKKTMMRGDKGSNVSGLQRSLKMLGYDLLIDGDFGRATELAVRDFQRSQAITIDRVVGPETLRAIKYALSAADKNAQHTPKPAPTAPPPKPVQPTVTEEKQPPMSPPPGNQKTGFWAALFRAIFNRSK